MSNKTIICVNDLILAPFCPLDIKCKNLNKFNAKNLWKCIFKTSRRVGFSYFPKFALDYGGIFVDHVTVFSSNPMQQLR